MTPLLATLLVIAGPKMIVGGNPPQSDLVAHAIESVPACLRSCDKGGEVPYVYIIKGSPNAVYYPHPHADDPPKITVTESLIDDAPDTEATMEIQYTTGPTEIHPYLENLDSWMLHEYTHHWDVTCHKDQKSGKRDVDSFLKLRYEKMKKDLAKDPGYQKLLKQYVNVAGWIDYLSPDEYDQRRELIPKLDAIRAKYGLPERHRGDTHALDEDLGPGTEYFAIAVQTLVYQPDVFCKNYSADEIDWLRDHMGDCLATMPKLAPCYAHPFRPAPSTGSAFVGR